MTSKFTLALAATALLSQAAWAQVSPVFSNNVAEGANITVEKRPAPHKIYENTYNTNIRLFGGNLGAVDKALLKGNTKQANKHLAQVLKALGEIHGKKNNYEFEIINSFDGGIDFHQVIDDLETPESIIRYDRNTGEIQQARLLIIDPGNPELDRSTWLEEQILQEIAFSQVKLESGLEQPYEEETGGRYTIDYFGDYPNTAPVYLYWTGSYFVKVHAISGEIIRSWLALSGERQCIKKPGEPNNGHFKCNSKFEIFRKSNVCQNNHPACNEQIYLDAKSTIDLTRNWAIGSTGQGPTGYDLMYEAREPSTNQGDNYITAWFRETGSAKPIIGTHTLFRTVGTSVQQADTIGHEYGHAIHHKLRASGWRYSGHFADAYKEAVADMVRAFSTNNYTVENIGGSNNRYVNGNRTYNNWTGSDYYFDSIILSKFFLDARTALGTTTGEKFFLT